MKSFFKNSAIIFVVLGLATFLSYLFAFLDFQEATIIIIYMLAVIFISQTTSTYIYGLAASLISVLAFNFFFTHPLYTFNVSQPDYLFTFFVMFVASFLSSSLTSKLKNEKIVSQERTKQVLLMEGINKLFQNFPLQNALNASSHLISESIEGNVEIEVKLDQVDFFSSTKEYPTNNPVKKTKANLNIGDQYIGRMIIYASNTINQEWLNSIASIISQNVEKIDLIDKQNQADLKIREQKLRNNLLGAISHDLRTPLATIIGSSDTLIENASKLSDEDKTLLLNNIKEDSTWLMNSVENILSFMRVEEGFHLNTQLESVEELFGDVLSRVISHTGTRVELELPDQPIYYPMDIQLMEKVLLNLVDNALKYSPKDSKIFLRAFVQKDEFVFEVSDQGQGIPDDEKKKIFERFYTFKSDTTVNRRGLGLGLAICKSIVEAHHGIIIAKDNKPSGTIIRCIFPYTGGQYENTAH